jgi:hypothetical protein
MSLWQRHWTLMRCSGCRDTQRMNLDAKRQILTCQRCGMVFDVNEPEHKEKGNDGQPFRRPGSAG